MKYELIYEAINNNTFLSLPYIAICVFEILFFLYIFFNWKHNNIGGRIGMVIIPLIVLIVIVSVPIQSLSSKTVFSKYQNGEASIVEGTIEHYQVANNERGNAVDRFVVDGISFVVPEISTTGYGYTHRQIDGGVLKEGQRCIIHYVSHKEENVIMKLLVETK